MCQHVGGEAEDVAAQERGSQAFGETVAENESGPRGERGADNAEQVESCDWSDTRGQRQGEQAQQRNRGRPGQVEASRRKDEPGEERVQMMRDRIRPPDQAPDEESLIDSASYVDGREMRRGSASEQQSREAQVDKQRGEAGPPDNCRCDRRFGMRRRRESAFIADALFKRWPD